MPLVTRLAATSTVYSQATAPTITQDGEVWIDTDTGAVYTSENGSWVAQSVGAIGTARQGLIVNSGATALEYAASMQSLLTASGDIIYASAANTPARLAKGSNGTFLSLASGVPAWAAAGATVTTQEAITTGSGDQTLTADAPTFEDITGMTLTMPTRTNGKAIISATVTFNSATIGTNLFLRFMDNGVAQETFAATAKVAAYETCMTISYVTTLSGQIVKVQGSTEGGGDILIKSNSDATRYMCSMEIS